MKYKFSILSLFIALLFITSCDNDDDLSNGQYAIPTTYDFDNVSYSGQTERLNMLEEMTTYMKTANTAGVAISAEVLNNMYANENSPFENEDLNTSTKQLKSKTFAGDVALFEERIAAIAVASESTEAGTNGVAGVVSSSSRDVLCDENGYEITQLIEKGLMGACFFYQISEVYLSEDKIGEGVDNETITEGEGTDMEHHWDEAFGYFGAPIDFPTNTDDIRFWAKYANGRDAYLGCNKIIMDAYLAGRAAISNNDEEAKWENAAIIKSEIERVSAATAIHYLNSAKSNITDDAERNHVLSEVIPFVEALSYNADGIFKTADIENLKNTLGNNFYEVSAADIEAAKSLLSTAYGLDEFKDLL